LDELAANAGRLILPGKPKPIAQEMHSRQPGKHAEEAPKSQKLMGINDRLA